MTKATPCTCGADWCHECTEQRAALASILDEPVFCTACAEQLAVPSETGLCGFCEAEQQGAT